MTDLPSTVSVREVGPRDGLQNEEPVATDAKVALIDALSRTGVSRIEAVSFVHPKAIPQMADADAVWSQIDRAAGVRYSALVPNLRGAQRALDAGFTEIEAVVSASDTHNSRNVNRSTDESLDEIAQLVALAHDRGAHLPGHRLHGLGLPLRGRCAGRPGRRSGRPRGRRRGRRDLVRRHDRDGDADAGHAPGGRVPLGVRRHPAQPALPQHPRHRAWPTCWPRSSSA
jgi:hypothetical protein